MLCGTEMIGRLSESMLTELRWSLIIMHMTFSCCIFLLEVGVATQFPKLQFYLNPESRLFYPNPDMSLNFILS